VLKTIEILGLRGFAQAQTLNFAIPNGTHGSGLTILVGANNAGKSTAIEAIRAMSHHHIPSFTQGRRNIDAGDIVKITVTNTTGANTVLESIRSGSSEVSVTQNGGGVDLQKLFVLPSRRVFSPFFNKSEQNRIQYLISNQPPSNRQSSLEQFTYRLFTIEKNRAAYDAVLSKVINPVPDWSIDQHDDGRYFLKIRKGGATHSSEGMGEGLVSLLYIIDALYDSSAGDVIVIDEPELSLHPALQRKLSALLVEYSADRQIVIATHSPYFVDMEALGNGATIARAFIEHNKTILAQLSAATAASLKGLISNANNPHIFGLNAQEIFFVEDQVILVEGQEDVIFYKRVESSVGVLNGTFFGWGVGGAANMPIVCKLLEELGYARVVGILDGNMTKAVATLQNNFAKYHFFAIPADDVRTKPVFKERAAVKGLLDSSNSNVRPEFLAETQQKFVDANAYLRS
jgi:AAA15 family ATPase/GTPase